MRVWNSIYANSLEDILKNENWRIKKLNSVKKTIICASFFGGSSILETDFLTL